MLELPKVVDAILLETLQYSAPARIPVHLHTASGQGNYTLSAWGIKNGKS